MTSILKPRPLPPSPQAGRGSAFALIPQAGRGSAFALIVLLLTGCAAPKAVPVTERRDSIQVRTETRVDSVVRDRWHVVRVSGDTVYVRDSVYIDRLRWRDRSDTVRVTDSVPVIREVPVVVRRRNGYDRFVSWGFWLLLALVAVVIAVRIWLKKSVR